LAAQIVNASMLQAAYNLLWYPALPFALLASHPGSLRDYRERWGAENFRPARARREFGFMRRRSARSKR